MKGKKNSTYLILAVITVISIVAKQKIVEGKRNKKVISIVSEWGVLGKPVMVEKVVRRDVKLYTKISLTQSSGNIYESDIPKSTQQILFTGQTVYLIPVDKFVDQDNDKREEVGKIIEVQKNINNATGMFKIKVSMDKRYTLEAKNLVTRVHTGTLKGVISIPNQILDRENGKDYTWVVEGNKAAKRIVIIDKHNGYGAIVSKGLNEGDEIIVKGFTILKESDKINILKQRRDKRGEHD